MPELPEVETVRDGLDRLVVGAVVRDVEVFREYSVRRHDGGPDSFRDQLTGRRLTAAVRRGKFLWLPLAEPSSLPEPAPAAESARAARSSTPAEPAPVAEPSSPAESAPTAEPVEYRPAAALLAHLGMSGQLLVRGAEADPGDNWQHPHLRVRLHLDGAPSGARYLDFVDQRTFGHLSVHDLVPDGGALPAGHGSDLPVLPEPVAHIARDLLDPSLDLDDLVRRVRRRRTQVKRALLDQTVVSGVGNIYADEALWRAKVHWARATDKLRAADVRRVLESAAEVMREALAQGGTSFDELYVNVNGQSGYFDRSLAVYGRENEECRRCGALVRRDAFMNRSSFSCPVCQPRPRGL
ncbi:DNA-(apurinic or apyrimidinic site) lyase [Promicromonospora sp. AC04]|uniref:bifunctional DNA-formamidopyrimidine glycosylase/DNA-(apurinic or apyrimidinic site) lyase n=1 Tax=Promicromonospora sp. AC04 TaxID=2135723 RepID=UPI000D367B95|nr:bifunctional DNA-formamidopyrimidine glycosylase/DNA-(apurinic or apyrimidinic site) lyase [Promicromonospora sp. AC04]PUB24422.1 DNA-(apurinic or apyrimidinic site) lyase [Promicromonospora sp. AC04]